ncbi:MAG: hypothetical protein ACFE7R_11895, partial [Candidatus Hodarchaeota archaeon]
MAQKQLTDFSSKKSKSVTHSSLPEQSSTEERRCNVPNTISPQDLGPSYFVSASYDGKTRKAVIKLYEPCSGRIFFWYDNTGHRPYCLTNLSQIELERISSLTEHPGLDRFEIVEKYDPISNRKMKTTKVVALDPLAIGGRPRGCIRDIIPEEFP